MITKGDEELEQLKTLMASTQDIFQGVFITANGKDVAETKKWCEEKGYHYSYLYWNDSFSEQRNFNFAQAEGYDYICWADTDDIIVNPKDLLRVARISKAKGFDIVFFDYWYGSKFKGKPSLETFVEPEVTQKRERLIKPGTIVWKKRLHESPLPVDGERFSRSEVPYSDKWPVVWLHLGGDRQLKPEIMANRMARNRRLLEMDLADEKTLGATDPRTILYLMKIYAEMDDEKLLQECLKMGEEYIAKSGWDQERATCCKLMSTCYGKMGQHSKAKELLHQAIEEYPFDPALYLYLARTYFNLKNYSAMKHWLEIGLSLNDDRTVMSNLLDNKILSSQLMLQYYFYGDKKNVVKAWQAARLLYKVNPTPENKQNETYLFDLKELDLASANIHKVMLYMRDIDKGDLIPKLIEALPKEIQKLPFAWHFYNKYKEPKVWGVNEICYFANFGREHFEKWSPLSLKTGIGGSETAVIRLSEELTKLGWKVTVYGDPGELEGEYGGVTYLPWYKFNIRDKFQVFIQWRTNTLAGKVSAKKYLVDMHDLYWEGSFKGKPADAIMVKSEFHKNIASQLTNMEVVSNGI